MTKSQEIKVKIVDQALRYAETHKNLPIKVDELMELIEKLNKFYGKSERK